MLKTETIERLQEFIKRAEYIRTLSYLEAKDKIVGFETQKVGDKWQVDFYQPSSLSERPTSHDSDKLLT